MMISKAFAALLLLLSALTNSLAYQPLSGVTVQKVSDPTASPQDIGEYLSTGKTLFVFGTYAADFNAIEYGQRLRYYWPKLQQEKGFDKCAFLLNCQPTAATALAQQIDLPDSIELFYDNTGQAGRKFGVGRGWLPDNEDVNPFLKLFGMLWGLGAWATLPAVIGGYIGNPFVSQPWITDALMVGQKQGRWPDNALGISKESNNNDDDNGGTTTTTTVVNKFDELPLVGEWPRRPLELATLRLQSMLGISLGHWNELAPDEEALQSGVLTQLGGCIATENDQVIYEYRDNGICSVANFEDVLKKV